MATAYRVFGPCIPQTGTGTANAYEPAGVCQKGGRVALEFHFHAIHTDLSGPSTPAEWQQMGVSARISFELATVDEAVLSKILKRSMANGAGAEGTPGVPGTLMGTGGHAFSLYLPSVSAPPWVFDTAVLLNPENVEGTVAEPVRLTFQAWRFVAGNAVSVGSSKLFSRVAPS